MPKTRYACALPDGRRIRYSLQKEGSYWYVHFPGPAGKRLHPTTKESVLSRAADAAPALIRAAYCPMAPAPAPPPTDAVQWDEAIAALTTRMQLSGVREGTINDYLKTIRMLKTVFPNRSG